ncbi:MAG: rod shape-determining protein RodA [Bacteroidaceae bacterium]|nr:rod shape-determining protein RodA [Bacteroidaceae bacterium]
MATVRDRERGGVLRSLDWVTIVIYLTLLGLGWMSVCGATYDFDQGGNFLDFGTRSGMQLVWIATSLILGTVLLLVDERLYENFSYVLYALFVVLLFVTPFLAHDIKGSLSWIKIGTFSIQPAEFAKFATALCIAKYMSASDYNISRWWDFGLTCFLILLPMVLIVMQKETGSALVYAAFFLMLYREGMPGSVLFSGVAAVVYFVVGVRFAADPLWEMPYVSLGQFTVFLLIMLFTIGLLWVYTQRFKPILAVIVYGLGGTLASLLFAKYVIPFNVVWAQLGITMAMVVYLLFLGIRHRYGRYVYVALFALASVGFHYSSGLMMSKLKDHQRTRIEVLLGLKDDPRNAGYNVIQAKIAIGSGGLRGKGFLNGTQTKLKYVPEQETDFIFCTVGEEEGFLGCSVVLGLFLLLILRLIHLAERQPYAFGRIYGYCVLSIFLFHVFINVGMVLGLTPVIGIPLPFFSYGGSSLWGFTILLFIFLRMDAGRNRFVHNS